MSSGKARLGKTLGNQEAHLDGEASQITTPLRLPNFRRFKTGNNPNADTYSPEEECVVTNRLFKCLTDQDYKDELIFPPSFCKSVADEIPSETVLLSCKGTWVFQTQKCPCHGLFALSGKVWQSFRSINNLEDDDAVLFEQIDQMVFIVRIFSRRTTCVKNELESPDKDPKLFLETGYSLPGIINEHHQKHHYPRMDGVISRFFRPVIPGFEEELRLAPVSCKGLAGEIPADTILISSTGMYSIPTEKCRCHGFFVLSGQMWKKFILDHNLQPYDRIYFEQTDEMVFEVRVFNLTDCEKRMLRYPRSSRGLQQQREDIIGDDSGCFRASIKKSNLRKKLLTIPSGFVREHGFGNKQRAILVNADGDAWEVELDFYRDTRHPRSVYILVSLKMRHFFKYYNVKVGNEFTFQVDGSSSLASSSSIVMNVKVLQ